MRLVLLLVLLIAVPAGDASAQPSGAAPPVSVSPSAGGPSVIHQATASDLPAGVPVNSVLFDPTGHEISSLLQTDATGAVKLQLAPPDGGWTTGLYRWVVGLGTGRAVSGTFAVEDGAPHLLALPNQPSPTSALNFVGIGLAPNAAFDLVLLMSGAQGQRTFHVPTDSDGTFSIFVYPQEVGVPFFAAGNYQVTIPSLGMSTPFLVREHPVSATVSVTDQAEQGWLVNTLFQYYPPQRYLWATYAGSSGQTMGELLLGPTNRSGSLRTSVRFDAAPPGQTYLATPYDWGETAVAVVPDPPTATATATVTPTATPQPTPAKHKPKKKTKCTKKHRRAKACKKR